MDILNPDFDWSALLDQKGPYVEQVTTEVCDAMTAYCRKGIQQPNGRLIHPAAYLQQQMMREVALRRAAGQLVSETGGGFITPEMYPNFFESDKITLPHEAPEIETSYLDWVYQRQMKRDLEDRKEWGFSIKFVRVRRSGQIEYGKFADNAAQMTNEEWGAGIEIFRSWFEMNDFGIKMNILTPEVRAEYYNNIADIIYNAVTSATWGGSITPQNILVSDINNAVYERRRYVRSWDSKHPYENVSWRIIAPIEFEKYMNAAMMMNYAQMGVSEVLQRRIATTYTTKLPFNPAACKVYLVADKWKQNELGTRLPFGVFGTAVDIDTFADKISYRGAWGFQLDPESGTELTFDTTASTFMIAPPLPIIDKTPATP